MSTLLCCTATFAVLYNGSSIVQTPQSCSNLCGVDCSYSGLNPLGACLSCPGNLRQCSANDNSTFAMLRTTIVNKTDVPRNGCNRNRKCLLCNNTRITEPFPANSRIYFSSSCNVVENPQSKTTIHVYYSSPNAIIDSEIFMQSNLDVVFHVDTLPLQFSGQTKIKTDSPTTLQISTSTNDCPGNVAAKVSPFPDTGRKVTFLASEIDFIVPNTCECGVSVSSLRAANKEKSTKVDLLLREVSVNGVYNTTLSTFFPLAAANVYGKLGLTLFQNSSSNKIISLPSQFSTLDITVDGKKVSSANLVDLSKMMSVFGSFYEIEFFNNGQEYKHEHSLWVPVVNRYLAFTLIFFRTLAFANGLW